MPDSHQLNKNTSEEEVALGGLPRDVWEEIVGHLPNSKDLLNLSVTSKSASIFINKALKQKLTSLINSKKHKLWREYLLSPDMRCINLHFCNYYNISLPHLNSALINLRDEVKDHNEVKELNNKFVLNPIDYFEAKGNALTKLKSDALANKELIFLIKAIELVNNLELKIKNLIFQYLIADDNLDNSQIVSELTPQALLKFFADYLNNKKISIKVSNKISKNELALLKKIPITYLKDALALPTYQTNNELLNLLIFAIAQGYLDNIFSSQQLIAHANKSHESTKFIMGQTAFFTTLPADTQITILNNAIKKIIDTVITLIPYPSTIQIISTINNASDKANLIQTQLKNLQRAENLLKIYPGMEKNDSAILLAKYQEIIRDHRKNLITELAKTIPSLKIKHVFNSALLVGFAASMPILLIAAFAGIILGSISILPFFAGLAIFLGCLGLFALQSIRLACGKPIGRPQLKSGLDLEIAQRYVTEHSSINITLTAIPEPVDPAAAQPNDNASHLPSPLTAGALAVANNLPIKPAEEFPEVGPSKPEHPVTILKM